MTKISLKSNQLTVSLGGLNTQVLWFQESLMLVSQASDLSIYSVETTELLKRASDKVYGQGYLDAIALGDTLVVAGPFERYDDANELQQPDPTLLLYDNALNVDQFTFGIESGYNWNITLDKFDDTIFVFWGVRDELNYVSIDSNTGNVSEVTVLRDVLSSDVLMWTSRNVASIAPHSAALLSTSSVNEVYLTYVDLNGESHKTHKIYSGPVADHYGSYSDVVSNGDYVAALVMIEKPRSPSSGLFSDTDIMAFVFDSFGNEVSRFIANTQSVTGNQVSPRVAITDNGNILVAYFDQPNFNVQLELFTVDGTFLSSEILHNGYTPPGFFHEGPQGSLLFSYGATTLGKDFGGVGTLLLSEVNSTISSKPLPGVSTDRISGWVHASTSETTPAPSPDPTPEPTPSGTVTISGTVSQGEVLTASNTLADEDGLGTISYQWQADGSNISGATDSTYTLTQADVGKSITLQASYTDGYGNLESVLSESTDPVGYALQNGSPNADTLQGVPGFNHLAGGAGHDHLSAHADSILTVLEGGQGDDTLIGGNRSDIAVFSGNRADYDLNFLTNELTVTDTRLSSPDGTDSLSNLNLVKFADLVEFLPMASDRVALTGDEPDNTVAVNASKLYNGTRLAEIFVVSDDVSSMIMAGDGDKIIFQGSFADYDFAQLGSQLQVSKDGFVNTVNVGGEVMIETDDGVSVAELLISNGSVALMLGDQAVGDQFDATAIAVI